jgi:hypothetical protein
VSNSSPQISFKSWILHGFKMKRNIAIEFQYFRVGTVFIIYLLTY